MKNQYVGDIGDYGKYSLLRFLSSHGIRIGINWYLTENDKSSDGSKTDYLKNDSFKAFDPDVYAVLQKIVEKYDRDQKTVQMIEDADVIPNACFFDRKLCPDQTSPMERAWDRWLWYE